jgi:UPF0042 nucleotide-binding protein
VAVQRVVAITGMSGSGKSLAANCFEDLGFFCVDNLPAGLIPPFAELIQRTGEQIPLAALVIDARERGFLGQVPEVFRGLRAADVPLEVLFFDCNDEVLKRRFSESRRPHPMSGSAPTLERAIAAERIALTPLRDLADRVIDTSQLTSHQLRAFLTNAYGTAGQVSGPNVNVESFGFKYGAPTQADLLFDVRFLPNPYFDDRLRHLDGRSEPVQRFLDDLEITGEFMSRLESFLDFLIPLYTAEGKAYLTVALGCTGGKHRSVALAEKLGRYLEGRSLPCSVSHRDIGRE